MDKFLKENREKIKKHLELAADCGIDLDILMFLRDQGYARGAEIEEYSDETKITEKGKELLKELEDDF